MKLFFNNDLMLMALNINNHGGFNGEIVTIIYKIHQFVRFSRWANIILSIN